MLTISSVVLAHVHSGNHVHLAHLSGPCKMLYNNLKRVSADLGPGSARIVSVDVEDNPGIASQLKVQKLPTLLFLGPHNGKPAVRMQVGANHDRAATSL